MRGALLERLNRSPAECSEASGSEVEHAELHELLGPVDRTHAATLIKHGVYTASDVALLTDDDFAAMAIPLGVRNRLRYATRSPQQGINLPRPMTESAIRNRSAAAHAPAPAAAAAPSAAFVAAAPSFKSGTSAGPPYAALVDLEGDASFSRGVESCELPVRRVLTELHWFAHVKSLTAFLLFYIACVGLATVRMDWWTGYETLTWLAEAHENVGVLPLSQAETVSEISTYLGGSLSVVVSELKDICANCEVGITSRKEDMTFLGLEDFVCSDFDSVEGSAFYPERNCSEVDVQWAEAPTSLSAPCCSNQTLVKASVEMMTEALIYGIDFLPLTTLLNGGSDPSYDSVNYFVQVCEGAVCEGVACEGAACEGVACEGAVCGRSVWARCWWCRRCGRARTCAARSHRRSHWPLLPPPPRCSSPHSPAVDAVAGSCDQATDRLWLPSRLTAVPCGVRRVRHAAHRGAPTLALSPPCPTPTRWPRRPLRALRRRGGRAANDVDASREAPTRHVAPPSMTNSPCCHGHKAPPPPMTDSPRCHAPHD